MRPQLQRGLIGSHQGAVGQSEGTRDEHDEHEEESEPEATRERTRLTVTVRPLKLKVTADHAVHMAKCPHISSLKSIRRSGSG